MAGWRPRAVREATRGRLVSVARPYATQPQRRHQRESTTGRAATCLHSNVKHPYILIPVYYSTVERSRSSYM